MAGTKEPTAIVYSGGKGSWRGEMFMDAKSLNRWAVINLTIMRQNDLENFVDMLYKDAVARGMSMEYPIYEHVHERDLEGVFKRVMEKLKTKFGQFFNQYRLLFY